MGTADLVRYIRDVDSEGRLYRFYKTKEWRHLRLQRLEEEHYECVRCRDKSPAILSLAVTVHHVNEVLVHPELALSKWYWDANIGMWMPNLLPLCARCHNEVHGRFTPAEKRKQMNIEQW